MKKPEHIEEANAIGADSWALLNFDGLPKNASATKQIEALKLDIRWQENHTGDIVRRIEHLIENIREARG